MNDGTREAHAAARWWANHLTADGDVRTGDAMQEILTLGARSMSTATVTAEQVEAFATHLEQAILEMLRDEHASWAKAVETEPHVGSAFRRLEVDYHPDRILQGALDAAGIQRRAGGWLPLKTVMKVDPGRLRVKLGYKAEWEELSTA
ncbi:hypothetical protein ACBJ59_10740 [Nonomuraea sp. MTCD27]|uniref:hypothetical protein n=1 Tax=Nonomuraea sp. MTCD27 TaxID=1676747 RepID=UPI0035BF9A71